MKLPKLVVARSSMHGLGVFAAEDIEWGMPIIRYTGQKVSKQEGDRRSRFYDRLGYTCLFDLDRTHDIDGLIGGNEARLINHSVKPNCVVVRRAGAIWIHAGVNNIKAGRELFFDYGFKL